MQYAKRNAHRPVEKRKGNKKLPYIHVQDIEDYNSEFHRKIFYGMIDEMPNPRQMCCNPATVIKLYPVKAVITVVYTFTICETGFAFVKVIPFAVIGSRGSCDNCDIPRKTSKFKGF